MNKAFKQSFIRGLKRGVIMAAVLIAIMFVSVKLQGCGRMGDPEYPKGSTYPKPYPKD